MNVVQALLVIADRLLRCAVALESLDKTLGKLRLEQVVVNQSAEEKKA